MFYFIFILSFSNTIKKHLAFFTVIRNEILPGVPKCGPWDSLACLYKTLGNSAQMLEKHMLAMSLRRKKTDGSLACICAGNFMCSGQVQLNNDFNKKVANK